ncbi:unnamed protein product [marine sediment metagenome]|uniref:Adenylosuccinate synthetase n=1 Tax=marine sediment metagenome TaxID=412755 RepID=X1P0Y7_9ZZZZ
MVQVQQGSLSAFKKDVFTGLNRLVQQASCVANERHQSLGIFGAFGENPVGWDEDLSEVKIFDDLPQAVRDYVALVEEIIKVPVSIIGVGPKRSQTIFRK